MSHIHIGIKHTPVTHMAMLVNHPPTCTDSDTRMTWHTSVATILSIHIGIKHTPVTHMAMLVNRPPYDIRVSPLACHASVTTHMAMLVNHPPYDIRVSPLACHASVTINTRSARCLQ
jgi:hypothetical protein